MSDAFATADDAIFTAFGVTATFRADGADPGIDVTVVRESPTTDAAGFGVALRAGTQFIHVRVAEVAELAKGDTFTIGAEVLTVAGAPEKDGQGMKWRAEC